MSTFTVELIGGPCAGLLDDIPSDEYARGFTICKSAVYRQARDAPRQFVYAPQITSDLRGTTGRVYSPDAALQALGTLFRTLQHYVPSQIQREIAAINRIRRAVR